MKSLLRPCPACGRLVFSTCFHCRNRAPKVAIDKPEYTFYAPASKAKKRRGEE